MTPLAALPLSPLMALSLLSACAHPPRTGNPVDAAPPVNFDTCLITHMAAIDMQADGALRDSLIASQTRLLSDDRLNENEQAQRTSTLMQSYAPGAGAAIAEAEANDVTAEMLAADAITCGEALAE